ncbi:MAG: PLP-dependent aspartate aminotransferase family protein [Acidobacteriia bacterium]|nr:PLP-dependent aspartate aminotransferase family protein [Terriglobia bacterium]
MGFDTEAIHGGQIPDPATSAIITPIFQTSTYVQEGLGKHKGYEYARTQNPTRAAAEKNVCILEGGTAAYAFSSGMAAIDTVLKLLKAGDHVICSDNTYGGTFRLFRFVLERFGLQFTFVDTSNLTAVQAAVRETTRMIYVETPTNPVMSLTDLRAAAKTSRRAKATLVVDNTFMSPYFQRPLALGADIVVHSTTKFLNGHSDSVGGMVVLKHAEDAERVKFLQNAVGAILSPFDSWLLLRGTKTLGVRMRQHDFNGRKIAAFLARHPGVKKVYYPGLKTHPQFALAKRQMSGFGSMISFETGSLGRARKVLEGTKLFSLAESLGGVESLISHPATMTHASVPREERLRLGISDGLVRLSVGLENVEDLVEDLKTALGRI